MEANIYGYQKAPPQPTVMERLTSRFMEWVGLDNPTPASSSTTQQGQVPPLSLATGQSDQLLLPHGNQITTQSGYSTPRSLVSSDSLSPNPYDNMSPSDVDIIYNGVQEMEDGNIRDEQSILIIGESGAGKSYLARYLVEGMHNRNEYKHLVLITSSST